MRIPRYREKMSQTNANFQQTEQTGDGGRRRILTRTPKRYQGTVLWA